MGPTIRLEFERYGFYPAGGGRFYAEIQPCGGLKPLHLEERGEVVSRRVIAVVANLPGHIALREIETVVSRLNWDKGCGKIENTRNSPGPGNVVMVEIGTEEVTEIFSAFGHIGVSAETVATIAAGEAREYLASRATAGEHLTDQLLLPLALAGAGSFTAMKINTHARTNMKVISEFLPVRFETRDADGFTMVEVAGN
jgi:RNA 3'-terminal phosphate cyclase (ATP)